MYVYGACLFLCLVVTVWRSVGMFVAYRPLLKIVGLDILKNHLASVAFCRNSGVYNVQNGPVIRVVLCCLCKRVSLSLMDGGRMLSTLLSFMLPIAVLPNEV